CSLHRMSSPRPPWPSPSSCCTRSASGSPSSSANENRPSPRKRAELPSNNPDIPGGNHRLGGYSFRQAGVFPAFLLQPAMTPALRLRQLRKCFDGPPVVKDLSLEIAPGEIFGLLGPNGAGKSTTINMVAGVTRIGTR